MAKNIFNFLETYCLKNEPPEECLNLVETMKGQNVQYKYSLNDNQYMVVPLKVHKFFTSSGGKFPDGDTDTILIANFREFPSFVSQFWEPVQFENNQGFRQFLSSANSDNQVEEIIINPLNRLDIYIDSNYDNIQFSITHLASNIARDLGIYPIEMELPVLSELYTLRFGAMFLGITLNMIIFVLFVLSVMLLYNLLLVSIETKTFELGVIRILGLNKLGVISLIIV